MVNFNGMGKKQIVPAFGYAFGYTFESTLETNLETNLNSHLDAIYIFFIPIRIYTTC